VANENPSAFLRLFIAIPVPLDVRQEIGRGQGQLQRHSPPGAIRWTRPDQFHITLKYLGDVPSSQVAALEQSVSTVCAGCPALMLTAHGVGFFPSAQKPRVIWAGADDPREQLAVIHRQMDEAMRAFAPMEKSGRFTGHITLGRFKPGRPGAIEKLLERATLLRERRFGQWQAGTVELVRSELTSAGARHTPLREYPLARPAFPRE
jgi:2'-5' RNA ligase